MVVGSALLQTEQQRVALAISKLGGRAREWALTCGTSVDAAFPSWAQLKQQLSRMFAQPNQAYRIRSRFLATRQGKKELLDYVQELRALIAATAADPPLPDSDRPFSVVCDASDFAIGCALLQADAEGRERVIAFESHQLKAAEKNYPVHDKELLAMKYDLVIFRVHLPDSKPFVIYTDHVSLRTATQSPHLSQRMAIWLSFFAEYNFEVKYKPGRLNVVTDALSRRLDYELAHVTTVTSSVPDLIRSAYAHDDMCVALLRALGSEEFKNSDKELSRRLRASLHRYTLDGGLLYYSTDPEDTPRVVVPHDEDLKPMAP
ncbi:hypothetical protein PI124_g23773 [Phytophthora idaei]|nr:hypothetical protein PI124_g23773 [Phytophthora idaei]